MDFPTSQKWSSEHYICKPQYLFYLSKLRNTSYLHHCNKYEVWIIIIYIRCLSNVYNIWIMEVCRANMNKAMKLSMYGNGLQEN